MGRARVGIPQVAMRSQLTPQRSPRGTSLIRNTHRLGPYSGTAPRVIRLPQGGGRFIMSEVPF